ncbi:PREDICTED: nucleolin 1-like [Brassica oleracea var. oleracea]|uniref:RRM domain-containing protein n=1 Tax=Brassica oleracea var. oleracea TaxID=109376 RepID=A0A0D3C346_BRAOL|nr:PREDICTED: nucleolin 1-like [Brassica oleracea var. oleracea]
MDTYSSCKRSAPKAPFDSEAAAKDEAISSRVRISIEGYEFSKDTENEIRIQLVNHFKSCGYVSRVDFPTEPLLDSRAFVTIFGDGAKEKALQLNGSDMGGWNALVKFAPEEEDEEYQAESDYTDFVMNQLLNDERFRFGICVVGYDPSLLKDEVEEALTAHFSSCGVIIHVDVDLLDKMTSIYFSEEEGEASAMNLDGSQVNGFKINTMLVPTKARSNPPRPPGETHCGYCPPAQMLEFADETKEKIDFYMTEWRLNAMTKKLSALKKQRARALKKQKAWALMTQKARAKEGEGSQSF